MRHLRALLLVVPLAVSACSSPDEKKLTKENVEAISKTKALTGEEVQLLQGYVIRTGMASAFSGGNVESAFDSSKSIRQAINEQRQWIHDDSVRTAREKAEAEAAARRHEQELARLRALVTVVPVRKGFTDGTYDDYVTFQMVAKNNGEKSVVGFKGYVRVTDLFDDVISRLQVKEDESLAPGPERVFRTAYSYNQFMDRDTKLRYTEFEKMKFVWEPEVILFADGTQLAVPRDSR
jgi:hypothetical protein